MQKVVFRLLQPTQLMIGQYEPRDASYDLTKRNAKL